MTTRHLDYGRRVMRVYAITDRELEALERSWSPIARWIARSIRRETAFDDDAPSNVIPIKGKRTTQD